MAKKAKKQKSSGAGHKYWQEYSNLQRVKHDLICNYLKGWFPKLTFGGFGRVLFIDTHAGRGNYATGELGSPLVALSTLLNHSFRDRILSKGEVVFNFIEKDEDNFKSLIQELDAYKPLPKNLIVHPEWGESFDTLRGALEQLEQEKADLAPAFVFCDPFGFKLPGELLQQLMKYSNVELFVNVIWRQLDMAIAQGRKGTISPGMRTTLNTIFCGEDWLAEINSDDVDERAEQCASLFRRISNAKWATYIKMIDVGRTKYFLLHLSNHDAGRDLMKECIWKSCPDGGYYARKCDDHRQSLLIEPEPDLDDLEGWVMSHIHEGQNDGMSYMSLCGRNSGW